MRKFISLGVMTCAALALLAANDYRVIKEIKIGGDGGWDYLTVDSAARRLYVSHATHVVAVDIDGGKVAGDIPDTQGVHGIAIAPDANRGFTSNGRANNVTIFDRQTLKSIGQVKTGENPDSIVYEPTSGRIFTFNGRSKDSTAIDAKTGNVDGTIPMGGKPEFSVADGKGKIYVNIEDTSEIVEVDAKKLSVAKRYSLKPCDSPSGLAMDQKNRRLFSVCDNGMMIVSDPDAGKVIATPPIGQQPDGVAFDPASGLAFSANGDGTLTVVREAGGKWEVAETLATKRGVRTIALDDKTHNLFLPGAEVGPPAAATAQSARPRPTFLPDTFKILVVGK
jgi:DNA-binding beta-propeller fold protein YncE